MSQDKAKFSFEEFSYYLIYGNPKAKDLIQQLELMLMQPVALFGKDVSLAWANEGRNTFIRNVLSSADKYTENMKNNAVNQGKPQSMKRRRKSPNE